MRTTGGASSGGPLGLLLGLLLVASTCCALRNINKCCEYDEHLFYDDALGRYACEVALSMLAREGNNGVAMETAVAVPEGGDVRPEGVASQEGGDVRPEGVASQEGGDARPEGVASQEGGDARPEGVASPGGGDALAVFLARVGVDNAIEVTASVMPACAAEAHLVDHLFVTAGESQFEVRAQPDGFVLAARGLEFPAHAWCVDADVDRDLVAVLCPCADARCLRTCCAQMEGLDVDTHECRKPAHAWDPRTRINNTSEVSDIYLLEGKWPACAKHKSIMQFSAGTLHLQPNLSLQGMEPTGRVSTFERDSYCVSYAPAAAAAAAAPAPDAAPDAEVVMFCFDTDELSDVVTLFKGCVTLGGACALLATVVVMTALPELRANIHGKMALCHNAALLVAFIAIGVTQVAGGLLDKQACVVLSFVMQFTLLAAFFWLNVMCVEVSWVFSALRPVKKLGAGRVDRKFVWYSVYAWGTTTLISIITLICEFLPGSRLRPRFGEANCFFNTEYTLPQLVFLFGPMACLLAVNVGLFAYTAAKIISHRQQSTSILKNTDSNTNNRNKQNLILYLKLFTLMGVTWIFEIISWAVGGKNYFWLPVDCINLLRGVFIFVIFCCKRQVLDLLRARLPSCLGSVKPHDGSASSLGTKSTAASIEQHEMQTDNGRRSPRPPEDSKL